MLKSGPIGFIGVGHMGIHMCKHLMEAGYSVSIYDLRKENAEELLKAGAGWCDSIAELAKKCKVVMSVLPTPVQFEIAAFGPDGVVENLGQGGAFIDFTTNSPTLVRKAYERGRELGVDVIDAPISGGVYGAASGRLTLMVGGEQSVCERFRPLLETMSDNVVYCGGSGLGNVAKITNNLISLSVSILIGEALVLGVKSGLDLENLVNIIAKSSGATWRMNESFTKFLLKGNLKPGFAIDLALKDLRLAKGLADETGLNLEMLNLAVSQYTEAQRRGWGNIHSEGVVKLLEESSGIELRIPEK